MSRFLVTLLHLILVCFIAGFDGAYIQFYKNKNYTDLLFQSRSTSRCNNVPGGKQFVASLKTDTCLIVYKDANCESEWSWKKEPNDGMIWPSFIGSYHICNDDEGGSSLNVDITTISQNADSGTVLQSYRNISACHNLPTHVHNLEKWSLNNHANDLLVFYEPGCSEMKWKGEKLRAGFSYKSRNMQTYSKTDLSTNRNYKIQSIAPASNFSRKYGIMELEFMELANNTGPVLSEFVDNRRSRKLSRPTIQFFEEPDEFLFDRYPSARCTNLPKPNDTDFHTDEIFSIKTDVCIMLFSNYNCEGRSFKFEPGENQNLRIKWESTVTGPKTLASLYRMNPNWKWYTKSFISCTEGNSRLNIDLTEYQTEDKKVPHKLLKPYREICTCQNIPKFIRAKEKWSMNNFGSTLVAYFEHDCMSNVTNPLWIPAGRSSFTIGLGSFKQTDQNTGLQRNIQSFGPDPYSAYFKNNCVKMFSVITKFVIDEPTNTNYEERNETMTASKTTFRNDGPSQLTQTYSASKTVRELVQVDIGKSFTKMNSVHVDKSVDIETRKHKGSSESNSSGRNTGYHKSNSNSISTNTAFENKQSNSKSTHESVDGTHATNVGGSITAGGEVEGGGKIFGLGGATVKVHASATVHGGYTYTSHNTQGNSTNSEYVESISGGQSVGQESTSGYSGGSNVGHEKSANFFQENGFRQGLRKAYDKSGTQSSSLSNSTSLEHTRSFSVSHTISVPPCTEQVVDAFVKVVVNKRVEFRVIAKITGKLGDREMTAAEVKQFMDSGFEYIGNFDDETVLAYSTGYVTAEYGVSSDNYARGNIIKTCQEQLSGCPVCQTCASEQVLSNYDTVD